MLVISNNRQRENNDENIKYYNDKCGVTSQVYKTADDKYSSTYQPSTVSLPNTPLGNDSKKCFAGFECEAIDRTLDYNHKHNVSLSGASSFSYTANQVLLIA